MTETQTDVYEPQRDALFRSWCQSVHKAIQHDLITDDDALDFAFALAVTLTAANLGSNGAADYMEARMAKLCELVRQERAETIQ
jgi:hypothetical protein